EYKTKRVIGVGTYGVVKEAVHIPTGRAVALKIIKKSVIKEHHKEGMVERELNILKKIRHPHIVEFIDYFETKSKYYIVFELATGGELFDRICQKRKFTEKDAAIVITTVVGAVSFLHARGIVHRDIKPENLLYRNNSPNSDLLLCDFGISKMIESPEEMLTTVCGSPGYTAPEILKHEPYSKPVDMWSIGVITYTLLCGYSPFHYADDIDQLRNAICHGRYTFDNIYWAYISRYAKDFIKSLLQVQPKKRLTADEALQHTWL
ncbi:Pkinase-domain-containing protein, partial [Neocallimastix californiae]